MAESTFGELSERVAYRVHDPKFRRTSQSDMIRELNHGRRWVADIFGKIDESGVCEKESSELLLAANTAILDLPSDFLGSKLFQLIRDPEATGGDANDRVDVVLIRRHQIHNAGDVLPSGIALNSPVWYLRRRPGLKPGAVVFPKSTQARYFILIYRNGFPDYATDPEEGMGLETEFDEILEIYAAIKCASADEERIPEWKEDLEFLVQNKLSAVQGSADETETEQVEMHWLRDIESPSSAYHD